MRQGRRMSRPETAEDVRECGFDVRFAAVNEMADLAHVAKSQM